MQNKFALWLVVGLLSGSLFGITYHRSFRGGYPTGAQGVQRATVHRTNVLTNLVNVSNSRTNVRVKVKRVYIKKPKNKPEPKSSGSKEGAL